MSDEIMATNSPINLSLLNSPPKSQLGEPAWEIATLFPAQGQWSELEYLSFDTNRMIELNDGTLEFLPMTTELHQLIVQYLYRTIFELTSKNQLGLVLIAPFRVRVSPGKIREPDVMFMLHKNRERRKNNYWEGADLVIEVVSDEDPNRDLVTKRTEYAQAKIPEYWIVDPRDRTIRVLTLDSGATEYRESGCYGDNETAQSVLLNDFGVSVKSVFDQDLAAD